MAAPSDRGDATVQRAAWSALWKILLASRPDEIVGRENGNAVADQATAADEEVHGNGSAAPRHP